jgi:hypothetical protein
MRKVISIIGFIIGLGGSLLLTYYELQFFNVNICSGMGTIALLPSTLFLPFVIWLMTGKLIPSVFIVWGIMVLGFIIGIVAGKEEE